MKDQLTIVDSTIIVKTRFMGIHQWSDAPDEVSFLRHPHRHIFHIKVELPVYHDDRELEYFMVTGIINNMIGNLTSAWLKNKSCEHIAKIICNQLCIYYKRNCSVEVTEDNENGSRVVINYTNCK